MRRLAFLTLLTAVAAAAPAAAQAGSSQAGHARARRLAELGRLPAPAEITVAHVVNYHRHGIPLPKAGEDVALDLRWDVPLAAHPDEAVLQIGLSTAQLYDLAHAPPLNLALVIDRSGSMGDRDKMSRVKQALERFVEKLRPADRVAVIAYSNDAEVVLRSAAVGDGAALRETIAGLRPGGGTNLHAGLMLGYEEVARHHDAEATNRVVLLTDGIANRGVSDPREIARASGRHNREGIDLSTIGVGEDLNHDLLAGLAKAGRGLFQFVADAQDIDKVFDAELQSLFGAVAREVELRVAHAPDLEVVRVHGHDVRAERGGFRLRLDDFNYGLTNVVLVEFRRRGFASGDARPGRVRVALSYRRPGAAERVEVVRATGLADGGAQRPVADREVRKNHTIAVMARALRRMAEAAAAKRHGEAERHLRLALDYVRLQYPTTEDPDLLRVRRMLEQYKKALAARIERFRDL